MIFIERAALQQQPPAAVENKHRKGAMEDPLAMGAYFVDDAEFVIVFVDVHEHRSGGHCRLIHPLRVASYATEG